MSWINAADTWARFAIAGAGVGIAVQAFQRRRVPGAVSFGWMVLAIALWCATSGAHHAIDNFSEKIALSKIQYLGISAVPPLWFLFARAYERRGESASRLMVSLLWIVPTLTILAAFSNDWHHWLWAAIRPSSDPSGVEYVHGPWFWVAAAYNYLLLGAGTWLLIQAQQRYPSPYRAQSTALMAGAAIPWCGNILYITGFIREDLTPLAFAASSACLAWGVFRLQLLDLVPIARDLLFDRLGDPVFVLDPRNRVLDMNARARILAGPAARAGRPLTTVFTWWQPLGPADAREPRRAVTVEIDAQSFDMTTLAIRDDRGNLAGWLVVMHDVTERIESDARRRTLERRLLEQQHVESLSVLAGGLAHDFNNLLAGVIGNADLMMMQLPSSSPLQEPLGAVLLGAERAADLVAKMLAYAGEGRVLPERLDVHELVEEMSELVRHSVGRHRQIVCERADALPEISADSTQIRQVILNLLVNAAEATPEGGTLTARTGVQTLTLEALHLLSLGEGAAPGAFVFVEIADTGRGMDETTLARAFDPFFTTKATGTGLGLASVHGIVRGHRGALHVRSTIGVGSVFTVWLPVRDRVWDTQSAGRAHESLP